MEFNMTTDIGDKINVGPVSKDEGDEGTVFLQIITEYDGRTDDQRTVWLRPAERRTLARALNLVS